MAMATVFFDRAIVHPITALRAQQNPIGLSARAQYFITSEVVTRVIGLFASVVAFAEIFAQLRNGQFALALRFVGTTCVASFYGVISPGTLIPRNPPAAAANANPGGAAPAALVPLIPNPGAPNQNPPPAAHPLNAVNPANVPLPVGMVPPMNVADGEEPGVCNCRPMHRGEGTPLHTAVEQEDVDMNQVQEVFASNNAASLNQVNKWGQTVLFTAIHREIPNGNLITLLLNQDAVSYFPCKRGVSMDAMNHYWTQGPNTKTTVFKVFLRHTKTGLSALTLVLQKASGVPSDMRTALSLVRDEGENWIRPIAAIHIKEVLRFTSVQGFPLDVASIIADYGVHAAPEIEALEKRLKQAQAQMV